MNESTLFQSQSTSKIKTRDKIIAKKVKDNFNESVAQLNRQKDFFFDIESPKDEPKLYLRGKMQPSESRFLKAID